MKKIVVFLSLLLGVHLTTAGAQVLGEWNFDEDTVSSALATDSSGNNYHGVLSDSADFTNDGMDNTQALYLNGASYVEFIDPTLFDFDADEAFSISMYVKGGNINKRPNTLISKMEGKPEYKGWYLRIDKKKRLEFVLSHSWKTEKRAIKVVTHDPLNFDAYNHIVVSYDGSRKAFGVSIHVNGVAQTLRFNRDKLVEGSIKNTAPMYIGRRLSTNKDTKHDYFTGYIDTVAIIQGVAIPPTGWEVTSDRVFYSEGNVGIGTQEPQATLDVNGDLAIAGNVVIDAEGKWVGDTTGLGGSSGGATMDTVCESTLVGAVRYNTNAASLEYCDGTAWNLIATNTGGGETYAASCKDALDNGQTGLDGNTGSGVYRIDPTGNATIDVYCDMETQGGGWTMVMALVSNSAPLWNWHSDVWNTTTQEGPFPEASSGMTQNFASTAYSQVTGNDLMIQMSGNPSAYAYNVGCLGSTTLRDRIVNYTGTQCPMTQQGTSLGSGNDDYRSPVILNYQYNQYSAGKIYTGSDDYSCHSPYRRTSGWGVKGSNCSEDRSLTYEGNNPATFWVR